MSLKTLAAFVITGLLPATIAGADSITVNPDGTVAFSYTVSGLNLLSSAAKVDITGSASLTSAHWGKLCVVTGTGYTITLPPAGPQTGYGAGATLAISIAASATPSAQFLIKPQSGQTLDGQSYSASTAGLVLLPTNYIELISVGGNWISRVKKVDTDWTLDGTIGLSATTSNPTKPTDPGDHSVVKVDRLLWRRIGGNVELDYQYYAVAAGSGGSGVYLVNLPTGFLVDTTKVSANTNATNNAGIALAGLGNVGTFATAWQSDNNRRAFGAAVYHSTTTTSPYISRLAAWMIIDSNSGGADMPWQSGTNAGFGNNPEAFTIHASVPIANW